MCRQLPLPVMELPVTESAVESGTTESQAAIPLNVTNNIVQDAGGLEITLASTLVPEIAAPARRVFEEDVLPFLEPIASELAIAANLQILGQKYGQVFAQFAPEKQAALALYGGWWKVSRHAEIGPEGKVMWFTRLHFDFWFAMGWDRGCIRSQWTVRNFQVFSPTQGMVF